MYLRQIVGGTLHDANVFEDFVRIGGSVAGSNRSRHV